MNNEELHDTLLAVFELSRANLHIDASSIARAVGLTPTAAATALLELERSGLVDASRARLTMAGLVVAVSSNRGPARVRLDLAVSSAPPERPARHVPDSDGLRVDGDEGIVECPAMLDSTR
jgi:hypothetical protein